MASSCNPRPDYAPLHTPVHRIASESDEEDEEGSSSRSHPNSPEKLDVVSTSSFVFHRRPHSSNASSQRDSLSPTRYCDEDAGNRYVGSGSAPGGTTIVHEQIETIITTEGVPDAVQDPSDGSFSSQSRDDERRNRLFADQTLNVELDLDQPAIRVPFPELGLDLLDIHLASLLTEEARSSEIRLTDLKSWDENWLFRQRKKKANSVSSYFAFADLDFASEPVRMFIPNPSHSAKASIGQLEADVLSDLSEKNSAASLTFSSDSESETEANEFTPSHQSGMTPSLLQTNLSASHKTAIASAKAQVQHDKSRSDLSGGRGSRGLEKESESWGSGWRNKKMAGVEVRAAKGSCFPVNGKQEERHDPSSTRLDAQIALPSFLPISNRVMASSCSDPCFVIKPCGASVQTEILVQFCCRVKGSRPLGVAWFKGDHLLTDDHCFRIFSSGNEFVLEIRSTQMSHTDVYSCVVYNGFGEQWSDFSLGVKERTRSPVSSKSIKSAVMHVYPCRDS